MTFLSPPLQTLEALWNEVELASPHRKHAQRINEMNYLNTAQGLIFLPSPPQPLAAQLLRFL